MRRAIPLLPLYAYTAWTAKILPFLWYSGFSEVSKVQCGKMQNGTIRKFILKISHEGAKLI
jgi:hypothetical protein